MRNLLIIAAMLAACGESSAQVNPKLAGQWSGTALVTAPHFVTGEAAILWSAITIATDQHTATVTPVCPDGYRTATLQGTDGAAWSGRMECYPVALGSCVAVTLAVTLVTAEMRQDGGVRVLIAGEADGCGAYKTPFAVSFLSR